MFWNCGANQYLCFYLCTRNIHLPLDVIPLGRFSVAFFSILRDTWYTLYSTIIWFRAHRSVPHMSATFVLVPTSRAYLPIYSRTDSNGFNPRPGGGLFLPPSRLFDVSPEPLRWSSPNFQCPPGHQFYTLWPKLLPKAMIGCPQMTSEWRHVLPFSAKKKGFAGRAVRPTALKIQKNVQDIKGVKLLGVQNCYLKIVNFWNSTPQNKK